MPIDTNALHLHINYICTTKMKINKFNKALVSPIVLVAVLLSFAGAPYIASAAQLLSTSVALSSAKISTTATSTIKFTTPSGEAVAGQTIVITYQNPGFNFTGKAITGITFTHGASTGLEASEPLLAAPSATAWGAVFSGAQNNVLTLTTPTDGVGTAALAPNDKVIITLPNTNAINPGTAASYTVAVGGTFGDVGTTTVNILNDDTVQVSAIVPQSLTFSLSQNAVGFGTLTTANARFANTSGGVAADAEAHTVSVGTNAANGYTLTVNGSTLTYGANTITGIGAAAVASAPNTKQFGLRATLNSGTGTVAAPYAGGATWAFNSGDTIASTAGSVAAATYGIHYIANIDATTPAGTYTSTINYAATANF
ncbi:MAG TPA: hypothetical protein VJ579_02775 [Candidatus Paceibacterota bacterium]|nr:hypothetical protein [Candidatus Paceibacterota bacterium]